VISRLQTLVVDLALETEGGEVARKEASFRGSTSHNGEDCTDL
jgi:hypothetical protein